MGGLLKSDILFVLQNFISKRSRRNFALSRCANSGAIYMSYLGLLCLGLFVGGVIGMGVTEGKVWGSGPGAFATIFGAALGGSLGVFLQFAPDLGDAVFAYPMGLVLGFIWPFVRGSWGIVKEGDEGSFTFALGHVLVLLALSAFVLAMMMFPEMRAWIERPTSG
ncbi:MAG: hypothetical protein AAFU41_20105 [Pseudomonadota bacterium]